MILSKVKEIIRVSKKKIVNIATNKAIITVAIFFYLALILIKAKDNGQVLDDGNNIIHILRNFPGPLVAAPLVAAPAVAAPAVAAPAVAAPAVATGAGEGLAAAKTGLDAANVAKTGIDAANATKTGLDAANAAKTGLDAANTAKTSVQTANAAKDAATVTPKSMPTNPNAGATSTKSIPRMNDAASKVGNKSETLEKLKSWKKRYDDINDVADSVRKKKDPDKLEAETEKGVEQEDILNEGTGELTGKSKISKIALGIFSISAAIWIGFIAVLMQWVSPTTSIMDRVGSGGGGSNPADTNENVGTQVAGFLERLRNALILRGFYTDEEKIYAKIVENYQYYYNNYGVEIDIPAISATLFYDVNSFGDKDKDGDGLPEISDALIARTLNVDAVSKLMLQLYETKFTCTQEVQGETTIYKKVFNQTYPVEENQKKPTSVCSAETIGQEIYEYRYEVKLDDFFDKLAKSDVLTAIYGDKADTDMEKRAVAMEIEMYRETWLNLYGERKKDECPTSGTIPGNVLDKMQSPVQAPYTITSYYGYRTGVFSGFHRGIDVVPTEVVNIYAAADGVVTRANWEPEGGNVIEITHTIDGTNYVSQYGHLADNSITVKVGDTVTRGQPIALMGATGQVSGAHLHFQMWRDNLIFDNLLNPVNLFSAASNYIYECNKPPTEAACSINGAIASVAQNKGYNFNILRAIVNHESGSDNSELLRIGFNPEVIKARYNSISADKTASISNSINFNDFTVNVNGMWTSFVSNDAQIARNKVVELMATVTDGVYLDITMGNGQVKGSGYKKAGYDSAKKMFEELSKSKVAQVNAMVTYLESGGTAVINVLKNIGSTADAQLQTSITTLGNIYKPEDLNNWVAGVLSNYRSYRDNPNSKIETFIKECDTVIENPEWEVCSTYENKKACKNNIATYKDEVDKLILNATDPTRKSALTNAVSLWGYVRYCGARTPDYRTRCMPSKYAPVHTYSGQGFRDAWKINHNYTITYEGKTYSGPAGVAGLDCGGFVTWVINQVFETKFGYVLGGACVKDTEHTTVHKFSSSNLSVLRPGDGVCDSVRNTDGDGNHTIIYMGKLGDKYYFIHTGDGTKGVEVFSTTQSRFSRESYHTYFTYK